MSKKCEVCGKWLKTIRGYNTHYRMIHKHSLNPTFDFNEIKLFITSEIQKALKDFNFSRPINNDKTEDAGIIPNKPAKKMPKFSILEVNKHLVVKELKEQLAKGINNVLQRIGSFDNEINFLEIPVLA